MMCELQTSFQKAEGKKKKTDVLLSLCVVRIQVREVQGSQSELAVAQFFIHLPP